MLDTSFIIGYIILVLVIGYISSRRQTGDAFMIANRKLGIFSLISTISASMMGGTAMVVYTAYIFEFGIGSLSAMVGAAFGFAAFGLVAPRLRRLAKEQQFHTMADFFHFQFDRFLGNLVAVILFVSLTLLILKQFIVGTQILVAVSGYSYEIALLISAGVVLIYLALGGFRSVVKTDIFQYLALLFLTFVVGITMSVKADLPLKNLIQDTTPVSVILSFLIIGLLVVWYSPDMWQRAYAAKDDSTAKKSFIFSGLILMVIGLGITLIGLSARYAFPDIDPSQALVYGITHLLPPGILGLGVVLVFAAVMSSADTLIFVLATNVAKDFIGPIKKERLSPEALMRYTRISLVLIILFCAGLAYYFRNIIDLALINLSLGMTLVPVIIAHLKWKLKNRAVAISILSGIATSIAWIIAGVITPETMVSPVLVSAVTLLIFQKILKH